MVHRTLLTRRALVAGTGMVGLGVALAGLAPGLTPARAADPASPRALKFAWNANAICLAPVAAALHQGFFAKHNLDVELINYSGATDQLLQSLATAKADAAVGMALRWLKPLEQGFDVKLTAGIHGGCLRLLGAKAAGVTSLEALRGKTIAVTDMGSPGKNFFSVVLAKRGIDPTRDVEWRQYPADLLALALEKGEAQALTDGDPLVYGFLKGGNLVELATNLTGEYAHRVCCLVGIRGSLLREEPPTAAAVTRSLLEAQDWTAANPAEAAALFAQYTPKYAVEDLTAMLRSHTHGSHHLGQDLRVQLALYAQELKDVSVLKASTDPATFAQHITADVL